MFHRRGSFSAGLKADTSPLTCCDVYDSEVCIQIGLICCAIGCKCPTTLWKNQSQLFCFAISGACPPDHEIPCTCAFCFLALCPTCGICLSRRQKTSRVQGIVRRVAAPPRGRDADRLRGRGAAAGFEELAGIVRRVAAPPRSRDADRPRPGSRRRRGADASGVSAPPRDRRVRAGVRMRTKIHRGHKKGWGGGPVAPDAITRAVTKLHGAFNLQFLCAQRGAGVSLNMLSKFWRNSGISRPSGWLPHRPSRTSPTRRRRRSCSSEHWSRGARTAPAAPSAPRRRDPTNKLESMKLHRGIAAPPRPVRGYPAGASRGTVAARRRPAGTGRSTRQNWVVSNSSHELGNRQHRNAPARNASAASRMFRLDTTSAPVAGDRVKGDDPWSSSQATIRARS